MKILCLGHATYDITLPVDSFIHENNKYRVKEHLECGGGSASNAAYLLGKWGMDVTFAGVVGNDEYGRFIKKELESVNVNTDYLELSQIYKTTSSFIVVNKTNGSRTILSYEQNEMKMQELLLDFNPDVILIDGQEYNMSALVLEKYPSAISIMDASRINDDVIELSKKVDYLICSKQFAEEISGIKIDYNNPSTIKNIYLQLKQNFKNNIIVTLEEKGVLYEYNNILKILPGMNVKPVDTTGAGDIFHGAFTYGIVSKMNYEEIIKLSNIAAGLSVTKLGSRNSIFPLEEIINVYEKIK